MYENKYSCFLVGFGGFFYPEDGGGRFFPNAIIPPTKIHGVTY
jgi:hypothetical protein